MIIIVSSHFCVLLRRVHRCHLVNKWRTSRNRESNRLHAMSRPSGSMWCHAERRARATRKEGQSVVVATAAIATCTMVNTRTATSTWRSRLLVGSDGQWSAEHARKWSLYRSPMARDIAGMECRSKIHAATLIFVIAATVAVIVVVTLCSFSFICLSILSLRCMFVSLILDSRSFTRSIRSAHTHTEWIPTTIQKGRSAMTANEHVSNVRCYHLAVKGNGVWLSSSWRRRTGNDRLVSRNIFVNGTFANRCADINATVAENSCSDISGARVGIVHLVFSATHGKTASADVMSNRGGWVIWLIADKRWTDHERFLSFVVILLVVYHTLLTRSCVALMLSSLSRFRFRFILASPWLNHEHRCPVDESDHVTMQGTQDHCFWTQLTPKVEKKQPLPYSRLVFSYLRLVYVMSTVI